ncbi:hypothetical protein EDC94DRAFT_616425 [Helicostylum pulchrum]|uniref:Nascent polypeptide-associated complex subunit alpha-like UBA domain-containing protein n=1 Tax=Helicostylum pulchrum TaxID=562976 RepID=A0ABP9Y274_9FUNG|nr:hypothetical protein EDC94DRAFT_616425 [Helicostylum pulchrum]
MAAAHDHHDHSNCSHDHGEPKKTNVVSDEMTLRKQAAEKLTKSLVELQEIANEHRKLVQSKTSAEPVNKADVDLLMKEMLLTKPEAEAALRANKCDIIATLTSLVKQ